MKQKSECMNFLEKLAGYMAGSFSTEERNQIEAHLSSCDMCRKDLVLANTILNDEELSQWDPMETHPGPKKTEGKIAKACKWARERCSELASQSWFACFEPDAALSAVRSEAASEPEMNYIRFVRDIGDLQAEIYVRKTEDNRIYMKIRLLKDGHVIESGRVTLKKAGEKDMGRPLRRGAPYVAFEKLIFGQYHLSIVRHEADGKHTCGFEFEIDEGGIHDKDA